MRIARVAVVTAATVSLAIGGLSVVSPATAADGAGERDLGCVAGIDAHLTPAITYGRWLTSDIRLESCGAEIAALAGEVSLEPVGGTGEPTRFEARGAVVSTLAGFDSTVEATLRFTPDDGGPTVEWPTTLTSGARLTPRLGGTAFLSFTGSPDHLTSSTALGPQLTFDATERPLDTFGPTIAPATGDIVVTDDGGTPVATMPLSATTTRRTSNGVTQVTTQGVDAGAVVAGGRAGTVFHLHYAGDANYAPIDATMTAVDTRLPSTVRLGDSMGDLGLFSVGFGIDPMPREMLDRGIVHVMVDGRPAADITISTAGTGTFVAPAFSVDFVHSVTRPATSLQSPLAPTPIEAPGLTAGHHTITATFSGTATAQPASLSFGADVPWWTVGWSLVSRSAATVGPGKTVTLRASLFEGADATPAGVPAALQRRSLGGAWTTVWRGTTTSSGAVAVSTAVATSAQYRFVSERTSLFAPATSLPVDVSVQRSISATTRYGTAHRAAITVHVRPAARVYLQERRGGAWHTLASTPAKNGTATFTVTRSSNVRTLRAYVKADAAGSAAGVTFRIKHR